MRYLSHAVLHAGQVYRQSLVAIVDGKVEVSRFDREEHSTVFVSGLVAVVADNRVTNVNIGQLDRIVKTAPLVETAILRAMRYMKGRSLFVNAGDVPRLIVLQR
ncbi:MAG TPA: hypothetical protein PK430_02020 [Muribaculum sp.]|jgi:hypothetical protein|uniref:Uncharacterized protein n=1 Tax=Heminiphilus faecis TaxID=2601703 RepID=A0ABV4CSV0_9BACT|nr:hypothetical protein [Heminiphilus faecis]RLT77656.1 hypothetical protein D7V95_02815 [bacterium J10(2018)]HRF67980.1 hypothetical protein [Muribaculum sp.]